METNRQELYRDFAKKLDERLNPDALRAEGASAERARIRQMALDEATARERRAGGSYPEQKGVQALREFAALLEKP